MVQQKFPLEESYPQNISFAKIKNFPIMFITGLAEVTGAP